MLLECTTDPSAPPARFPVDLGGAGKFHTAFFERKPHTWKLGVPRGRKSGYAPVGACDFFDLSVFFCIPDRKFFTSPPSRHPEQMTCLRQVKAGMNMGKRCLQSRPRGPAPKISPARKGWVHRAGVERRRCGTTLFVCSLGAYPDFLLHISQ